ncbi:hypothetical protein F2P81_023178 [Scophthalmus maximus]|uniref:Uncharacterized protein n=1 Tax=Scophthalmus maximus TaxID=52904 RepID=A0A6A4RP88_SCOMX|nr:hypothetical protein F2P81_023178 [Scophthalmus maximus]
MREWERRRRREVGQTFISDEQVTPARELSAGEGGEIGAGGSHETERGSPNPARRSCAHDRGQVRKELRTNGKAAEEGAPPLPVPALRGEGAFYSCFRTDVHRSAGIFPELLRRAAVRQNANVHKYCSRHFPQTSQFQKCPRCSETCLTPTISTNVSPPCLVRRRNVLCKDGKVRQKCLLSVWIVMKSALLAAVGIKLCGCIPPYLTEARYLKRLISVSHARIAFDFRKSHSAVQHTVLKHGTFHMTVSAAGVHVERQRDELAPAFPQNTSPLHTFSLDSLKLPVACTEAHSTFENVELLFFYLTTLRNRLRVGKTTHTHGVAVAEPGLTVR